MKPIHWATACLISCTAAVSFSRAEDSLDQTVISGVVRDRQSHVVAGAAVSVVAWSHRAKADPLAGFCVAEEIGRATTDRNGRFELSVRKPTAADIAFELSASDSDHGVALGDLGTEKTRHELSLTLPPQSPQTVLVMSPDGKPLAGATIKILHMTTSAEGTKATETFSAPTSGTAAWPSPVVTGDDGKFELRCGDLVHEVKLEIDDNRVALQRWNVETKQATPQTAPIVVQCFPPRSAEGEVLAADGRAPLNDASVVIDSSDGSEYAGAVATTTDSQGKFKVRLYAGDRLTIRARANANKNESLSCHIPWIEGTSVQRMVLPLLRPGKVYADGTTADGRPASTIDVEVPTKPVVESSPKLGALDTPLPGTIVISAKLIDGTDTETNVIALDPNNARSHVLVKHGWAGRVSADGKHIAYTAIGPKEELAIIATDHPTERKLIAKKCTGPGCWIGTPAGLVITTDAARPQDYFGQTYWPLQFAKQRIGVDGRVIGDLSVPTRHCAFDVSRDSRLVALYEDTHCHRTGGQVFVSDLKGDHFRPIARKPFQYYWYPRFSPDGKSIVGKHLDVKRHVTTVHIVSLDGTQERSISLGEDREPEVACWSPDGKWVLMVTYPKGQTASSKQGNELLVAEAAGDRLFKIPSDNKEPRQILSIDWTGANLGAEK